jgi:putative peptidoglycan lipid II flippase
MSKRIGIAAVIWGVSVLLSRVIGVVRESVIGRVLGGGGEADVYWTAFVLPDFLNYLLAGGALSIVFIPMFAGYLSRGDEAGGWRVFSTIANFVLVVLGLATAVVWYLTPELVPALAPGFSPEQLEHLTRLTRIILPAQLFHLVGGLLSASLQARDKHTLPALATLGYTGTIVVMGLALGPTWGADAFAWGVLVGSAIGPFGLPLIGCIREGLGEGSFGWRPHLDLKNPDFKRYLWLSLPIMLAFSIMVVDDWLLKRYGSLAGEGTVSRLQYAKTLMKVPMGVFGLATGAAAYPTLSRLAAEGKTVEAYDTLVRACRMMLVLAFASQAAFTVAGADVAEVIWGTERFTAEQLNEIGLYTGLFCLALGAWSANTLVARGYYAQQLTWMPSLIGSVMVVAFWPVYRLAGQQLGGMGLALASSAAVSTYVVVLSAVLRRKMAGPTSPALWTLVVRMLPAVGAGVGAGRALDAAIDLPALVQGALTGGLALCVTLLTARLLGVPEVAEVVALVLGKLRRKLGLK